MAVVRFRRWVVFTFAIHVLIVLLDKGAGLILFKILDQYPDIKGACDLITNLPTIMMALANLGLATSTVYFVRRKAFPVKTVAQSTTFMAVVWGSFVAGIALLASQTILPLIQPDWDYSLTYVVPVCLCVPFLLTTSYYNSLQLAVDRIRDYNLVNLFNSIVFLPLFLVFYYAVGTYAPTGIALARLSAAILICAITVWMLRGVVSWRPRPHWGFLKEGLTYGWKANVVSVVTYLNHRLDLILVPLLYSGMQGLATKQAQLSQAAFYSLAVSFSELVWHFPEATRDLFFSKVAGSTHEEARQFTPTLCRLCFTVAVLGAIGILFVVDPLMTLISPEQWNVKWQYFVMESLEVLVPGTAAYTVAKILQNDLAARGHLNHCMIASVLVLAVMLGLDVLWIPKEGSIGASWASTIAYVVAAIYTLFAYRASGGAGLRECLLLRRSDGQYVRELWGAIREKIRRKTT